MKKFLRSLGTFAPQTIMIVLSKYRKTYFSL